MLRWPLAVITVYTFTIHKCSQKKYLFDGVTHVTYRHSRYLVSLTLPIVTRVTSSLTLQLLALDCVNSIMDKHRIVLGILIYETTLVEGEI